MAKRIGTSYDFTGFSIIAAMMHPVSANPSGLVTGDKGRIWFNTTTNRLMVWDGTTAIDLLDLSAATGTLTASKVSDFVSAVQAIRWASMASPNADVSIAGFKLTNVADGVAGSDAATWGQVLAMINNQVFKNPVRVASTANVATLAGGAPNTVDGVALATNDRILVKDQSTGATNGIYTVSALGTGANGTWVRATDADSSSELLSGSIVPVQEGAANGDKLFMLTTNAPITLGTTALTFLAYGASTGEIGVAGAGLTKTGVTYDVVGGTGITVGADLVSVDYGVTAGKKGTVTVPAATGGAWTISGSIGTYNHGLGTTTPDVKVFAGATPLSGYGPQFNPVELDWVPVDANNVAITFPAAPASGNWVIGVQG